MVLSPTARCGVEALALDLFAQMEAHQDVGRWMEVTGETWSVSRPPPDATLSGTASQDCRETAVGVVVCFKGFVWGSSSMVVPDRSRLGIRDPHTLLEGDVFDRRCNVGARVVPDLRFGTTGSQTGSPHSCFGVWVPRLKGQPRDPHRKREAPYMRIMRHGSRDTSS